MKSDVVVASFLTPFLLKTRKQEQRKKDDERTKCTDGGQKEKKDKKKTKQNTITAHAPQRPNVYSRISRTE